MGGGIMQRLFSPGSDRGSMTNFPQLNYGRGFRGLSIPPEQNNQAPTPSVLKNTEPTSSGKSKAARKPKPNKSPSSLKRTASASLPIRSNPTPTRGAIQPVFTYATAERYNLSGLQGHMSQTARRFEDAWWVPLGLQNTKECEAWVFGNGTINLVRKAPEIQFAPLTTMETEELEFVIDPAEPTRLQGDLIILGHVPPLSDPSIFPATSSTTKILPSDNFPARYAFSQALARSTALSALETSLDAYLSSVELLPQTLSETGEPGLRRKELIQKLGHLLKFRQGLNLSRENFGDTPDFYWAEPVLEVYFNTMSKALEIHERIGAVNKKITYAAEVQVTLRELLTESSSHRMELIIIALIAVEVAIAIIRDGPELWHMAFGGRQRDRRATAQQPQGLTPANPPLLLCLKVETEIYCTILISLTRP
ncbi:hypothetical protein BS47DRAFT_1378118, partial [Hydnum rufescens UP504]